MDNKRGSAIGLFCLEEGFMEGGFKANFCISYTSHGSEKKKPSLTRDYLKI
jgi:hypothetical protein